MSDNWAQDTFKLGFGLMRLPKLEDGSIDIPQVSEMADRFIAAGGTYFDTAYVYDGGGSEAAFKAAVADRYPRDRYTLATKLNAWHQCHDEQSAKQQFYTSLERTGAGYFDYYLLHALQRNNYQKYDEYHIWDFVKELKEKGLIRHYGFSFHADPEFLIQMLTEHPDVEFVQLQVKSILDRAGNGLSYASWAVRYAAGLPGIVTVLSGMSSLKQMEDNLSYMRDFQPLTAEEQQLIREAQNALSNDRSIACTSCHYCVKGCPMNIPIPEIFTVVNRSKGSPHFRTVREYNIVTQGKGKAHDCIQCGQCESACPQHLPIISLLKNCIELEA